MTNKLHTCGRPQGKKKTAKIEVVLEPQIKAQFMEIMSDEGKSASVEIGGWIREYIKSTHNDKGGK